MCVCVCVSTRVEACEVILRHGQVAGRSCQMFWTPKGLPGALRKILQVVCNLQWRSWWETHSANSRSNELKMPASPATGTVQVSKICSHCLEMLGALTTSKGLNGWNTLNTCKQSSVPSVSLLSSWSLFYIHHYAGRSCVQSRDQSQMEALPNCNEHQWTVIPKWP